MSVTICLHMIVRQEARIIRRCLEALRPHIDTWVIVDTGSTDGTPALVADVLRGVPGRLHHLPWEDFGRTRTKAIRLAEGTADYLLLMDADVLPIVREPSWRNHLGVGGVDLHLVWQEALGGAGFRAARVVNGRPAPGLRWRYWGATHEYLGVENPRAVPRTGLLEGISIFDVGDGGAKSDKYVRDERLLRAELARLDAPGGGADVPPGLGLRTLFYLAQTLRDQGRLAEALPLYERRAAQDAVPGDEEAWQSAYQAGLIHDLLGAPRSLVVERLLAAHARRPWRAEPLIHLARICRQRGDHAMALLFARRALDLPLPVQDRQLIETDLYRWRVRDEFALASGATGDLATAIRICGELLQGRDLPADQRARVAANLAGLQQLKAS